MSVSGGLTREQKILKLHTTHELGGNVISLNNLFADGGSIRWELRTVKAKIAGKGNFLGIGFYDKDGKRLGIPNTDVPFDIGPMPVHGLYLPDILNYQKKPAPPSTWKTNLQLSMDIADEEAPPDSTEYALAKLNELFVSGLPKAAYELKCLFDSEQAPDAPYFSYIRKTESQFMAWYDMLRENKSLPITPVKLTNSGVNVLNTALRLVDPTWSKDTKPPTGPFAGPTADYAKSCEGGEDSVEYKYFSDPENRIKYKARLPWVRYSAVYGRKNVPPGDFRSVLGGVQRGSSVFLQANFKSIFNSQKDYKDPIFWCEPQGLTVVSAVSNSPGQTMVNTAVDYARLENAEDIEAVHEAMMAEFAAIKKKEEPELEYVPGSKQPADDDDVPAGSSETAGTKKRTLHESNADEPPAEDTEEKPPGKRAKLSGGGKKSKSSVK